MDEQIKQLADRLWRVHPADIDALGLKSRTEFYEQELKKFAELIVEEMYDFMCKATDNDGAWPSSKEVKQHFGVDGMSTEDKKNLIKELLGVKE